MAVLTTTAHRRVAIRRARPPDDGRPWRRLSLPICSRRGRALYYILITKPVISTGEFVSAHGRLRVAGESMTKTYAPPSSILAESGG